MKIPVIAVNTVNELTRPGGLTAQELSQMYWYLAQLERVSGYTATVDVAWPTTDEDSVGFTIRIGDACTPKGTADDTLTTLKMMCDVAGAAARRVQDVCDERKRGV